MLTERGKEFHEFCIACVLHGRCGADERSAISGRVFSFAADGAHESLEVRIHVLGYTPKCIARVDRDARRDDST